MTILYSTCMASSAACESYLTFVWAAIGDVGGNGVAEEAWVLGHHPYLAPVPGSIQLCQRPAIYQHLH